MNLDTEDKGLIKATNSVFNSLVDFVKVKAEKYDLYAKYPFIKTTYQLVFAYILELSKKDKVDHFVFYKRDVYNINGTEVLIKFKFYIHDFKKDKNHQYFGLFIEPDQPVYFEKASTWPSINVYLPKLDNAILQDSRVVTNRILKYINDLKESIIHELGHAYDFWSSKYRPNAASSILRDSYKYINFFIYFMSTMELRQMEREIAITYRRIVHDNKSAAARRKTSNFIKSVINVPGMIDEYKNKDSYTNVYARVLYSRLFRTYPQNDNLVTMYESMKGKKEHRKFIFLYIMLNVFPRSKYGKVAKNDYDYRNFKALLDIKCRRKGMTAKQYYAAIYRYITSAIHYMENNAMYADYYIDEAKRCFSDIVVDYAFESVDEAKKLYELVKSYKRSSDQS